LPNTSSTIIAKNSDAALSFLRSLYGNEAPGFIALWTRQDKRTYWFPAHELDKAAAAAISLAGSFDVYFGAGLRREALTPDKRGGNADIIAIPGLWADVDIQGPTHSSDKLPPTLEDAIALIREFPLTPTVIVTTGGGIQAWWLFKQSWVLENDVERQKATHLLKGLQNRLQANAAARGWHVDSTHDLARVLRLPGTWNRKTAEPMPVVVFELNEEARYNPADFEPYILTSRISSVGVQTGPIKPAEVLSGVPEGQRNVALFRYACQLRRRGLQFEEARVLILEAARNCSPPLDKIEALRCLENAWKYPPGSNEQLAPEFPFQPGEPLGVCGDFARLLADNFEAPFSFWLMAALTVLGSAVSGFVGVQSGIPVQPRLYTILTGPSALARKSSTIATTIRTFQDALSGFKVPSPGKIEVFNYMPQVLWGLGSGEGLATALKDVPTPRRVLLALDEAKALVSKAKIEGSILLPLLCKLFELNNYDNFTKKAAVRLFDVHLSLIAAATTETYQGMWTPEFIDIGFTNRIFLVPGRGDKSIPFPAPIPEERLSNIRSKIQQVVMEIVEHRPVLNMTPEAERFWADWYSNRPQDPHALRLDDIGLRLCLLLEISRSNFETIESDTVERVIQLLEWQYEVRQLLDPLDVTNVVAELEERIRRVVRRKAPLSQRDLAKAVNAHRYGLWAFNSAVENLTKAGEIFVRLKGRSKVIDCA